jgi:hypothetical protein
MPPMTRSGLQHSAMFVALALAPAMTGCGLSTPDIHEVWQGAEGTRKLEFEIKRRIYCDLKHAVQSVRSSMSLTTEDSKTHKLTVQQILPDDWGTQISLLLQVDESTSFNPGVALTTPFSNAISKFSNGTVTTPRSFSLGLGATLSSTATRIDKFDPYYTIGYLNQPDTPTSICNDKNDPFSGDRGVVASGSLMLSSELRLDQWLHDAMFTDRLLPSVSSQSSGSVTPDTVSIEIKFIVVSSGSINPVWKLLPITVNNGSASLLSAGRTRTHDLLITIGPESTKTANTHLASQIGQAINAATPIAQ